MAIQVEYLQTVIVPLSNPDNAQHMLALATDLIDPEAGKVLALKVAVDEDENKTNDAVEGIQKIVDEYVAQGHAVELVTQVASSVTRGILDGAREYAAETLIIGVHNVDRERVKLGSVVENIIAAAPCNVLVYRPSYSPEYDNIVIPLTASRSLVAALNAGTLIAQTEQLTMQLQYIQRDYSSTPDRERLINGVIDQLPMGDVTKDLVQGRDPAERLLRMLGKDDLLIMGFEQKDELDKQIDDDFIDKLLNRAPGPVLLASQIFRERRSTVGKLQRQLQRFNPALTQAERNEMVWQARKDARTSIDYLVLIVMSAALASLGLLINSVAVIIGAMLVAPLMAPLGALSTGMATGQLDITRKAAFTLIQGVLLSLAISVLAGFVLPVDIPTTEMLARGNPTLLDAAVALVSGLVAAFAIARREIPVALAGVAIAAALMPPICVIGLGIALNNQVLAIGATLLFLTNITFIIMSENVVFLWVGMRPGRRQETQRGVIAWWLVIVALVVTVVFSIARLSQSATLDSRIETYILSELNNAEHVSMDVSEGDNRQLQVRFTVQTSEAITPQRVRDLQSDLSEQFARPVSLQLVPLAVVSPADPTERQAQNIVQEELNLQRVEDLRVSARENGLLVDAVVRTRRTITGDDVARIESRLADALNQPVTLSLSVQQIILPPMTATPLPTATPASTADDSTADE